MVSSRRFTIALVCALSLLLLFPVALVAQEHSATSNQAGAQNAQSSQATTENQADQGATGALAQASREAAGEDENNFNQYPSVMFLSRLLHLRPFVAFWLSIVINFAVLAGAIGYFMKKHLPGAFRNRTASIQQAMSEAQRSSEDARRRLSEIENRLSRLDSEIAAMRETAERDALAEEARIRAAAEEDTRKIVEAAGQEIDAAASVARRELKKYAAEIAVALAQQQLHIDAGTDEALVRSFASQLNGNGQAGKDGR